MAAISFTLRKRLLLLSAIPMLGLFAVGALYLRTLYQGYVSAANDDRQFEAHWVCVRELNQFFAELGAERLLAMRALTHPDDPSLLDRFRQQVSRTENAQAVVARRIKMVVHTSHRLVI